MDPLDAPPGGPVAIGIDFGTESGRVLVLELRDGAELAVEVVAYRHGVIDRELPVTGEALPPDWALQHPGDWMEVLRRGVPASLVAAAIDPRRVVAIGVDFTSCTVLPTDAEGTPLCLLEPLGRHPHAWPKLWKHHAAQPVARRMTEVALERGESFLARYGGRISSEWYFPKLIEIFEQDREIYEASAAFVEATDWLVWQLTGSLTRNACTAGYKALWDPDRGLPPAGYFTSVSPQFARPGEKLGATFRPLGASAGRLIAGLAEEIGLGDAEVAVAVGNVDSFASVPGCGVADPSVFVSVMGTSTCDMVIDKREILVPGITGVVRDGIVPGMYGYEAGQPAVGDMLAWFVDELLGGQRPVGGAGAGGAAGGAATPGGATSEYGRLEAAAAGLAPGATGLCVLDWWNGNRTILADADLSGVVAGLNLRTAPAELYRALLESVAFGERAIVDNFGAHDLRIDKIVACGGIAEKSPLAMQLLADASGLVTEVPRTAGAPARGAALYGAVAAGTRGGGFASIGAAVEQLGPRASTVYRPDPAAHRTYDEVYRIWRQLHDVFGRSHVEWLHSLKRLRQQALGA